MISGTPQRCARPRRSSLRRRARALADKIKNPTAVFSGLDKITGRIISFEVEVDETVQFGALQLTPRVCYTRPPTESPQTTTFVEVDEVTLDNKYRRIFTGWMFASSPGLHGIEHAIYDIWLTDCKGGAEVIVEAKDPDETPRPADRPRARPRPPPDRAAGAAGVARRRAASDGRLDVPPPRGVPVQPQQQPTRRFFPTNPRRRRSAASTPAPRARRERPLPSARRTSRPASRAARAASTCQSAGASIASRGAALVGVARQLDGAELRRGARSRTACRGA